jgi:FkbM family methyltransferase
MSVTIRRALVNAIERSGARSLISFLATAWARKLTKLDVEIFYDEFWMVRLGDSFLPRNEYFDIYSWDIENLRLRRKEFLREPIDYWTYLYTPQLGDVIFDIGAGCGTDALVFSEMVGTEGKVYAFEAHPTTFRRLQKTCRWNQLKNVRPIPRALWSESGSIWISDLEDDISNNVQSTQNGALSIKVEATDLDAFVEENHIDRIDALKMNIEGAEKMAIRGMTKTIKRISNVVIACHDFRDEKGSTSFATRKEVVTFLQDNNFTVSQRLDDPRPYVRDHVYAKSRGK